MQVQQKVEKLKMIAKVLDMCVCIILCRTPPFMQDEINFDGFKSLIFLFFPLLAAGQEKRPDVEHQLQRMSAESCRAHEQASPVAHRSGSKTDVS